MGNRILIETESDSLYLDNNLIHAVAGKEEYIYDLSEVKKIVILTTNQGPLCDDMALAVDVGGNNVIFIMSGHRCFDEFLFNQIGKRISLDYQKIIEASSCVENEAFEIYRSAN